MSQPAVSANIFAALSKPKKTKAKERPPKPEPQGPNHAELEKAIFSAPAAGVSNWADDSDEDDFRPNHEPLGDGWSEVRSGMADGMG